MSYEVINREDWLQQAASSLKQTIDAKTELHCPADVRVTCGWPRQDRGGKVIGQCWDLRSSKGVHQLFISPLLTDPVKILGVLLHELIHAADDNESKHAGAFTRAIRAVGLDGKPTHTVVTEGSELYHQLAALAEGLGPYPHNGMEPYSKTVKKQTTRMVKCECSKCGYTVRTTRKWLDEATPVCPRMSCYDKFGNPWPMTIEEKTNDE